MTYHLYHPPPTSTRRTSHCTSTLRCCGDPYTSHPPFSFQLDSVLLACRLLTFGVCLVISLSLNAQPASQGIDPAPIDRAPRSDETPRVAERIASYTSSHSYRLQSPAARPAPLIESHMLHMLHTQVRCSDWRHLPFRQRGESVDNAKLFDADVERMTSCARSSLRRSRLNSGVSRWIWSGLRMDRAASCSEKKTPSLAYRTTT